MKFTYPSKPFYVTQKWGNQNPMYKANGFNFENHNGIDFIARQHKGHFSVFCPADGFRVVDIRYVEKGGGNEIWLLSKDKHLVGDKWCYLYMVFCHADQILVPIGYEPKIGEILMISDNTGFSTGEHTHWGLYRVDYDGKKITFLDNNDANGSYDPGELFTGEYAVDKATINSHLVSGFRLLKYYLNT